MSLVQCFSFLWLRYLVCQWELGVEVLMIMTLGLTSDFRVVVLFYEIRCVFGAHVWNCNVLLMNHSLLSTKWFPLSSLTPFSLKSIWSDVKGTVVNTLRGQCQAPGSGFCCGCLCSGGGWQTLGAIWKAFYWGLVPGLGLFGVIKRKYRWTCKLFFKAMWRVASRMRELICSGSWAQWAGGLGKPFVFCSAQRRLPKAWGHWLTWGGGLSTRPSSLGGQAAALSISARMCAEELARVC